MESGMVTGPFLKVVAGSQAGASFPLHKSEIFVGRGPGNDIILDDDMVSQRHAKITLRPDAVIIDDLESTNGTIVNGRAVHSCILKNGDRLLLGSTELVFLRPGALAGSSPTVRERKRSFPILVGIILATLMVIAGLIVVLLVLRAKEGAKDRIPPSVEVIKPLDRSRLELPISPGSTVAVEIQVEASDDRELNKVDIQVNGEKVATFRADEGPPFLYTYTASKPGTYVVKAVAFDAVGNEVSSQTVSVEVWTDTEKKSQMEAYVYQVDNLIMKYRQIRQSYNQAYAKGTSMSSVDPEWYSVAETFVMVRESFSNLRGELAAYPVTPEFRAAHINLTDMLTAAIQASNFGAEWAATGGVNSAALQNMRNADAQCKAYGNNFKVSYDQARMSFLGLGPSISPH